MTLKKPSPEVLVGWIEAGDIGRLSKYLVSGTVHGKPGLPVAELDRIRKILFAKLSAAKCYKLGKDLLKRKEYTARSLGVNLIAQTWDGQKDIEPLLARAADDEDWIVRESAAGACATLLGMNFPQFSKMFSKWVRSGSDNAKRAVALAVKYDSRGKDDARWSTYLKLIEPLLSEPAEYIRKNLGPFAIGDGLLPRFSKETLACCGKWAKSKDENVRWNTAMVFTAAAARKFSAQGRKIVTPLTEDGSPFVARAAKRALKNLA